MRNHRNGGGQGPDVRGQENQRGRLVGMSLLLLLLVGCSSVQRSTPIQVWDDMKHQQKFKAQAPVDGIFADGRSNRLLPEDTVPRSGYRDDSPYNTGLENGMYVGRNPVAITPALLELGQAKFNIYCSPCHDQTGMGRGIIPAHVPIWQPSNLTEDRVVEFADGDIFNVITNGRRTMPPYRYQVVVADRWAIIAYVRALQRAAHGTPAEAPAGTAIAALK